MSTPALIGLIVGIVLLALVLFGGCALLIDNERRYRDQ
jgi:hypothetical protein